MKIGKNITALFNVLAGKEGRKPQVWTGVALAAGAAAIGVGAAFFVCAWPLSAAFFAVSLASTGVSSAVNASGTISNHKHFEQITDISERGIALEQENLEMQQQLIDALEGRQEKPGEQASVSLDNTDTQNSPKTKKLRALFNVIQGKRGPRAQAWADLAIATKVAAIGVGVTVAVGAWPWTAAFFAASLFTTGISSAINAASSVGNHKHFSQITELQENSNTMLEKSKDSKRKLLALLKAQKEKVKAPTPGSGPG